MHNFYLLIYFIIFIILLVSYIFTDLMTPKQAPNSRPIDRKSDALPIAPLRQLLATTISDVFKAANIHIITTGSMNVV